MFTPFTLDNTEGFSPKDLSILNSSLEILTEKHPDLDEKFLSDKITNCWFEDTDTVEKLVSDVEDSLERRVK